MKTKILLTALAFVAFTTAGMAGDASKSCCSKDKTECCKGKDADKSKADSKTAKAEKTKTADKK